MESADSGEPVQVQYEARQNLSGKQSKRLALLSIQVSGKCAEALQRVAQRLSQHIRRDDYVLLAEHTCAVVLAGATFSEAEIIARRLSSLLADIEYEIQIVSGSTACSLLEQLRQVPGTIISQTGRKLEEILPLEPQTEELDALPYLAFLSNYPSRRLLHLFPYELACRYQCVPIGAERGALTIATRRRLSFETVAYFHEVTQRDIFQVRSEARVIEDVLRYWQQFDLLPEIHSC